MKMLSNLHSGPVNVRGRRGRIDLASLLWEVAPEARVSIEPGSGTEVFGEEAELRRMLHVILGHGSGSGSAVTIKREDDEVVIAVVLGPDRSPTADTERAWLSRMAIRYGGRYELQFGTEVLALPAEGVEARHDVAKLQKELDEARKQGQAYARELAGLLGGGRRGGRLVEPIPASGGAHGRSNGTGRSRDLAGGVAATLRARLAPLGRDIAELRAAFSPRKSSPDLEMAGRIDVEQRLEGMRHKLILVHDFIAELASIGEIDPEEVPRAVDLVEVARAQVRALEARAARGEVTVRIRTVPEAPAAPLLARVAPHPCAAIIRALLSHAIDASPRGSSVTIVVTVCAPTGEGLGAMLDHRRRRSRDGRLPGSSTARPARARGRPGHVWPGRAASRARSGGSRGWQRGRVPGSSFSATRPPTAAGAFAQL